MTIRRLVLVTNNFPSAEGDAAFLQHEIEALADAFDRVVVFSFMPPGDKSVSLPPNVSYAGCLQRASRLEGMLALLSPRLLRRAVSAVAAEGRDNLLRAVGNVLTGVRFARAMGTRELPDTETSFYFFWATRGAMALPFVDGRGIKLVRAHGYDLYDRGNYRPLRAAIFPAAEVVAPISENGRDYLLSHYPELLEPGRVQVSRLGTADHGIGPRPGTGDPVRVVSCSSLVPVKRVESLIPALQLLAERHPVEWIHFGGVPGPGFERLRAAARLVESSRLRIDLRGQVPNSELMSFYRGKPISAFVNVSSAEGVPVSVMEALSFDIPVVATDVGGTGEIVDARAGLLLEADPEPQQVADALEAVHLRREDFAPRETWLARADARENSRELVGLFARPSRSSSSHPSLVHRALVATRIHLPEPAAASFRLDAVERALVDRGFAVTVLTTTVPGTAGSGHGRYRDPEGLAVSRWPALRGRDGYLRGYLPYLSFDLPLFLRLSTAPRADVILVEPPPTTGAVVRIVAALRRIPYVWYAADIWSDASRTAGAPAPVVAALAAVERFAIRGAAGSIAVSEGVAERVRSLGGRAVRVVPNGIDTGVYHPGAAPIDIAESGISGPYLVYAGTASEWQGAAIFARAFAAIRGSHPDAQLVFVGQGTEWEDIGRLAAGIGGIVQLSPTSPERVARLLVGAEAALVSIVPGRGYDFAYPTKILAALATGTPVIFAGTGPAAADVTRDSLGWATDFNEPDVAAAMAAALGAPTRGPAERERLARWVRQNRSIASMGRSAAEFLAQKARPKR